MNGMNDVEIERVVVFVCEKKEKEGEILNKVVHIYINSG